MEFLTPDNHLAQALWIDAPDAEQQLQEKVRAGKLSIAEANLITHFKRDGYIMVDIANLGPTLNTLSDELEEIWQNPPFDLAAAHINHPHPHPMQLGLKEYARGPGLRLIDIHSHVTAARDLYLERNIHRLCSLLFDGQAIATQSLYFEYGSTQPLHRDPWYVNHSPRSHLLAAWFALEDIHPDAGPLNYVPGSHKLPYYRFKTNDIVFHDRRVDEVERQAAIAHMWQQIREHEMQVVAALPKRGQVFLWHGSLIHGGSPVHNPALTRRSFVVHFGRTDTHKRRGAGVSCKDASRVFFTEQKIYSQQGTVGWQGPLLGITAEDFFPTEPQGQTGAAKVESAQAE